MLDMNNSSSFHKNTVIKYLCLAGFISVVLYLRFGHSSNKISEESLKAAFGTPKEKYGDVVIFLFEAGQDRRIFAVF